MAKNTKPTFSIVIPCYNEASFIGDTLRSLQHQRTTASFEIIVVDNNCTDKTVAIAKKHGARIVTEKKPGATAARQAGTVAAEGEIVVSTDADTTFSRDWLETIYKDFTQHPEVVSVCGPCQYVDGPWWSMAYTKTLFGASAAYATVARHPFYVSATNIAFKKSFWHGYKTDLPQGGDELGLLHDLKKEGVVRFNNSNPTFTSSRRLAKGFVYSFFVTFLYYYIIGYNVDRIFKRGVIGRAPSFRMVPLKTPSKAARRRFLMSIKSNLSVLILVVAFAAIVAERLEDAIPGLIGFVVRHLA